MSHLFEAIEKHQGAREWGAFLDAGTGQASLSWCLGLKTESLTAVTGSSTRLNHLRKGVGQQLGPEDRLLVGNWVDSELLKGECFDTVLVDYLVGALDRFAPYYQTRLFERLRPLVKSRLYLVGLEPYPEALNGEEDGQLLNSLVALRDATLLLNGDRPHREFPRWWVVDQLRASGFTVVNEETFPILYGERFVKAELDVCRQSVDTLPKSLRKSIAGYEKELRQHLLARVRERPLSWGMDYLVVAEPC